MPQNDIYKQDQNLLGDNLSFAKQLIITKRKGNDLNTPLQYRRNQSSNYLQENGQPVEKQQDFGLRADETPKGKGFLGVLPMKDGSNKIASELSIGIDFGKGETEIPSLVPTLDKNEIDYLLQGNKPTKPIVDKAVVHAKDRIGKGLSPFAQEGEQLQSQYYRDKYTPKVRQQIEPSSQVASQGENDVNYAEKGVNALKQLGQGALKGLQLVTSPLSAAGNFLVTGNINDAINTGIHNANAPLADISETARKNSERTEYTVDQTAQAQMNKYLLEKGWHPTTANLVSAAVGGSYDMIPYMVTPESAVGLFNKAEGIVKALPQTPEAIKLLDNIGKAKAAVPEVMQKAGQTVSDLSTSARSSVLADNTGQLFPKKLEGGGISYEGKVDVSKLDGFEKAVEENPPEKKIEPVVSKPQAEEIEKKVEEQPLAIQENVIPEPEPIIEKNPEQTPIEEQKAAEEFKPVNAGNNREPPKSPEAPPSVTSEPEPEQPSNIISGEMQGGDAKSVATRLKKTQKDIEPSNIATGMEIMRGNLGVMTRSYNQAEEALKSARKLFAKRSNADKIDFIDKMEHGEAQSTTPELQTIADTLRGLLDKKRGQIQDLGTGKLENFIDNYFPHVWDDPHKAKTFIKSFFTKKPLEGSKAFLKQRTIEFTKDGIEQGLKPVSYNPVDLVLIKIREMDKYLMAHETLNELKELGRVRFSRGKKPDGFAWINDSISTVFSKNEAGETVLRGHYYALPEDAKIINNYLSPGLNGTKIYDIYRGAGNMLNQFQLGLSAFHLGFTSWDAMTSKLALTIEQGFALNPKAFVTGMQVPIVPITNIINGDKLLRAWLGKNATPEMKIIANVMAQAGGRAKMDSFYATTITKKMMQGFKSKSIIGIGGGILRMPFAAIEQTARPIMEYLVPRQKMGVFFDMIKNEMEQNQGMSPEELRRVAQKAWDSVDNRMGQLVYDNLFWNKVAKDLAMGSVRSLGWNLGTIREMGGGIVDTAKVPYNALKGNRVFTHRMAYTMALPILAGIIGGIYQYLRTGEPPSELKDYYFPKTGGLDKNGDSARVSFPTYMKDVYHWGTSPFRTVSNKLQPLVNMVWQMLQNKDFYGTEIRHPDDLLVQQALQELKFVAAQFEPFGIRNLNRDTRTGIQAKVEPFIGITPAPYDVNLTPAEAKAREIEMGKMRVGTRTQAEADKAKFISDLRNKYTQTKDRAEIINAIRVGKISEEQGKNIIEYSGKPVLERMVKQSSPAELLQIMDKATPEEMPILKRRTGQIILHANSNPDYALMHKEDLVELVRRYRGISANEAGTNKVTVKQNGIGIINNGGNIAFAKRLIEARRLIAERRKAQ
jgi:hypothetical protein